jgi:hypothetical protein
MTTATEFRRMFTSPAGNRRKVNAAFKRAHNRVRWIGKTSEGRDVGVFDDDMPLESCLAAGFRRLGVEFMTSR